MKSMNAICDHKHGRPRAESAPNRVVLFQSVIATVVLVGPIFAIAQPSASQPNPDLETYFRKYIGLSQDRIASMRSGQPVTKTLLSRAPAEVFLFGAVYIHAAPENFSLPVITNDCVNFRTIWPSACFPILRGFPT
jgi:hypothetical protein